MQHVGGSSVGAAIVTGVIIGTHLGHQGLHLGQFLVYPVIELFASLLLWVYTNAEHRFERCLMEEVEEIVIVQGAKETHLGNIGGVSHTILLGEILIEKHHVEG